MLNQMQGVENKINESQAKTIENAIKDKQKAKKYEDEINLIQAEYDQFREKDQAVLDAKVKHEVEFAILRISEKRYKAEAEVEELKKTLSERDAQIRLLEKQVEELKIENTKLREQ